jgi:lipid-A-disaccharide synthase
LAIVNGPGEVAGWLTPFAGALSERAPGAHLTAALLPCVFATGTEAHVLRAVSGVHDVLSTDETLHLILHARRNGKRTELDRPDAIVHFGGELTLSLLLARRLGAPLLLYAEHESLWSKFADRVFLARSKTTSAAEGSALEIGNLMVDAAIARVNRTANTTIPPDVRTIALFPGSRAVIASRMLPFLLRVASEVAERVPHLRWVVARSEFLAPAVLTNTDRRPTTSALDAERFTAKGSNGDLRVETESGVVARVLSPAAAMQRADLAITIPGTNTAELAALGIPMIVVLPAYELERLPLPGLGGHLGRLPVLGPAIKRVIANSYIRWRRHWAHPNLATGQRLVPELVGRIRATDVACAVCDAIDRRDPSLPDRLRAAMGAPGSARRLVDEVLGLIAARER